MDASIVQTTGFAEPERRWYQCRLRVALLAALACVIVGSYLAILIHREKRQIEARAVVKMLGGTIRYSSTSERDSKDMSRSSPEAKGKWSRRRLDKDSPGFDSPVLADGYEIAIEGQAILDADLAKVPFRDFAPLRTLNLRYTGITDAGLRNIAGLHKLRALDLAGTQVTDAGLQHLKRLKELQWFSLAGTQVTDAGIEHLKVLSHLEWLSLHGTQLTDVGIEHLKVLSRLEWLSLGGTQVTDAGLEHFRALSHLGWLSLEGTQVTDAGLEHLTESKQLEWLSLYGTQVTDAGLENLKGLNRLRWLRLRSTQVTYSGVRALRRALPYCTVDYDPQLTNPTPRRVN